MPEEGRLPFLEGNELGYGLAVLRYHDLLARALNAIDQP
jgi:hypothetical protein